MSLRKTKVEKADESDAESIKIVTDSKALKSLVSSCVFLFISVVVWAALTTVLGKGLQYNSSICTTSSYHLQSWTRFATFAEMCGFLGNVITLLLRLVRDKWIIERRSVKVILLAAICINGIAGSSSFLEFTFQYGGNCEDLMG